MSKQLKRFVIVEIIGIILIYLGWAVYERSWDPMCWEDKEGALGALTVLTFFNLVID